MVEQYDDQSGRQGQEGKPPGRRINGLYVFLFLCIGLLVFNYRGPLETIDCTPEVIDDKPDVVMLGAWWCTYCYQAKRYFQHNNISYCEYDMEKDPTGIRLYEENGGGAIPVMMIGQYVLKGYSEQQIDTALSLLEQERP